VAPEPETLQRDTAVVRRDQIFVDHGRNLSRGGRAIDPAAPSTIELAILIGSHGQRMPVSVRRIPARKDGAIYRLIAGYRRMTAMDVLHQDRRDYPVFVVFSNALTDFDEAVENFGENSQLPPKDFELAEGVSMLRVQHGLSLEKAVELIFSRQNVNNASATRIAKATVAWENLIQPLRELWRKNTPMFQLSEAHKLANYAPVEQEQWLEQLISNNEPDPVKVRIGSAAFGGKPEKPLLEIARRPTKSRINRAFLSLKTGEGDPHNDGLTPEERRITVKLLRWILGVPVDGKAPRCPIRGRAFGKKDADDSLSEDTSGVVEDQ
jgi:hypothetical protein